MALVRTARADDLPAILALYRQLSPKSPVLTEEQAAPAWRAILDRPGLTVFLAESEVGVGASCTLVVTPNLTQGARPYALIENVVTDMAQRRRGLGRAVLGAAIAAAWDAGCYKVMLHTGRPDDVQRFYEAVGFQRGKTAFEIRRSG